jgi:MoaA/NifB/PqqE/SkfB family radical SAM enzyme
MSRTTYAIMRMLPSVVQNMAIRIHLLRRRNGLKSLKTPTAIILYVTSRCNLRCGHCFYWDALNRKSPELTVNEVEKLVTSLSHPVSLSLTGGEPFLRKDLYDLVRCFTVNHKVREVAIATNGYFTREIAEFCRGFVSENANIPLSVQVSIDGMETTHDDIRGCSGSFRHAFATTEELLELAGLNKAFSVSVGVAVQKRNLTEISDLIDLLGSRGCEIRINLIRGESSGTFGVTQESSSHVNPKDGESIALDVEEMHRLYDLLIAKNEVYGFWSKRHQRVYEIGMEVIEQRRKVLDCYAGTIDGVIYANGDVAFCELTKPVGNLHTYDFDLQSLWQSPEAVVMRNKVYHCFCTHGCNISTGLMFDPEIVREAVLGKA